MAWKIISLGVGTVTSTYSAYTNLLTKFLVLFLTYFYQVKGTGTKVTETYPSTPVINGATFFPDIVEELFSAHTAL